MRKAVAVMHPAIEPHEHGMLNVGDGHLVYWEVCGSPHGRPAVVMHGGPGSGCTPQHRQLFDPNVYRIVLFDQRQCGRSTPHAGNPSVALDANTTHHLVADVELLRQELGIEQWLVYGNSWGSTLALAYAQAHPERVSAVVLAAVTMTRPSEIDWLYRGVRRFYPEAWQRFRAGVPAAENDGDVIASYWRLLETGDEAAAMRWCEWEEKVVGLGAQARYQDPKFRMAFARIVTWYFSNQAWLAEGELLAGAERLEGIPGVLVHGRLDIGSPLLTAWELAKAWPDAELIVVDGEGHAGRSMTRYVLEATARLA